MKLIDLEVGASSQTPPAPGQAEPGREADASGGVEMRSAVSDPTSTFVLGARSAEPVVIPPAAPDAPGAFLRQLLEATTSSKRPVDAPPLTVSGTPVAWAKEFARVEGEGTDGLLVLPDGRELLVANLKQELAGFPGPIRLLPDPGNDYSPRDGAMATLWFVAGDGGTGAVPLFTANGAWQAGARQLNADSSGLVDEKALTAAFTPSGSAEAVLLRYLPSKNLLSLHKFKPAFRDAELKGVFATPPLGFGRARERRLELGRDGKNLELSVGFDKLQLQLASMELTLDANAVTTEGGALSRGALSWDLGKDEIIAALESRMAGARSAPLPPMLVEEIAATVRETMRYTSFHGYVHYAQIGMSRVVRECFPGLADNILALVAQKAGDAPLFFVDLGGATQRSLDSLKPVIAQTGAASSVKPLILYANAGVCNPDPELKAAGVWMVDPVHGALMVDAALAIEDQAAAVHHRLTQTLPGAAPKLADIESLLRELRADPQTRARNLEEICLAIVISRKRDADAPLTWRSVAEELGARVVGPFAAEVIESAARLPATLTTKDPSVGPQEPMYCVDRQLAQVSDAVTRWMAGGYVDQPTLPLLLFGEGGTGKSLLASQLITALDAAGVTLHSSAIPQLNPAGNIAGMAATVSSSKNPVKIVIIDEVTPELLKLFQPCFGKADSQATGVPSLSGCIVVMNANLLKGAAYEALCAAEAALPPGPLSAADGERMKLLRQAAFTQAYEGVFGAGLVDPVWRRVADGFVFFPPIATEAQRREIVRGVLGEYERQLGVRLLLPESKAGVVVTGMDRLMELARNRAPHGNVAAIVKGLHDVLDPVFRRLPQAEGDLLLTPELHLVAPEKDPRMFRFLVEQVHRDTVAEVERGLSAALEATQGMELDFPGEMRRSLEKKLLVGLQRASQRPLYGLEEDGVTPRFLQDQREMPWPESAPALGYTAFERDLLLPIAELAKPGTSPAEAAAAARALLQWLVSCMTDECARGGSSDFVAWAEHCGGDDARGGSVAAAVAAGYVIDSVARRAAQNRYNDLVRRSRAAAWRA